MASLVLTVLIRASSRGPTDEACHLDTEPIDVHGVGLANHLQEPGLDLSLTAQVMPPLHGAEHATVRARGRGRWRPRAA